MNREPYLFHYKDSYMAEVLPPEGELITDLDKLVYTMGQVAIAAPEVNLPQFRYGFHGYQRVTQTVANELHTDTFEHPEKMARTMPYFAERAFAPIRHHVNGDIDKVGAWAPMLYSNVARQAPPSVAMVDFLGYHVIHDLPYTLMDTDTQPEHRQDYSTKINLILSDVGRELLPEYAEVRPLFKFLRAEDIGLWFVLQDLFKARNDAWSAFEELQRATKYTEETSPALILHDDPNETISEYRAVDRPPKTLDQIEAELQKKAMSRMLSSRKFANLVIKHTTRIPAHPWSQESASI